MLSLRAHLASYVAESPELANNIDQNQGGTIMCQMFAGQDPATYEPGFPRWITDLMTCFADSAIRINAIPSALRANPVPPSG